MFKKGFTLQELLITMAIIGVVAAITVPALMKIVPDENKVKYMKAYNTLTRLVPEILDNSVYYPTCYTTNAKGEVVTRNCIGINCDCNVDRSVDSSGKKINPANLLDNAYNQIPDALKNSLLKGDSDGFPEDEVFPRIFAYQLNLQNDVEFSEGSYLGLGSRATYFTTVDGITWIFCEFLNGDYDVYIDIDNKPNSVNSMFSNNVNNPDRFQFKLSADGGVVPVDPLGKAYLQNATNMHSKNEDRNNALKFGNYVTFN